MTDDELERRLRAHYAGIEPGSAPARLTGRIADALDQRAPEPSAPVRLWPAVAGACALAAILALGLVFGLRPGGFLASSGASPTVLASPQPGSPSPSPERPTSQASGSGVVSLSVSVGGNYVMPMGALEPPVTAPSNGGATAVPPATTGSAPNEPTTEQLEVTVTVAYSIS